jgi:predicted type IV restriction endonuclease
MDFIDKIRDLANQIPKLKQQGLIKTEEGTKNALIMPFINALGYNVFDPTEVTPELVADVGTKKGEKVDYAILRDGKPIMLFECKSFDTNLDDVHASQLYRYFSTKEARFGILTNGVTYQFYTDLEAPNKMDKQPFLVFNMLDIKEPLVEELKKFTKSAFNVEQIMSTASELKYMNAIKKIIVTQLAQPTDDFVRYFASQVYAGHLRQNVLTQFTEITKRAWKEVITDRMKETFTKAAEDATGKNVEEQKGETIEIAPDKKIITTEEEVEAYRIIRAITREIIDVKRVVIRDAQGFCSILFDDTNRQPICRLYFNSNKKFIGLIDAQKK